MTGNYIPKEKFEWIEEWHGEEDRKYLIGVIHFQKLIDDKWWKQHGVSLILTPEPIIENIEIRNLKKEKFGISRNNLKIFMGDIYEVPVNMPGLFCSIELLLLK